MKPRIFKLLGTINLAYLLALVVFGFVPFFVAKANEGSAEGNEGLGMAILAILGIILGIGATAFFVLALINFVVAVKKPSIGVIVYTFILIAILLALTVYMLMGDGGDGTGLFYTVFLVLEIAFLVYEVVYLFRARKRMKAEHPITYTTYIQ